MKTWSLKNAELAIQVNAAGAELSSLKDAQGRELLWQADKAVWPRHAPVLFPIVGKLKNDSYSHAGKNYSLPQHGFARDTEFILTEQTEDSLEFELQESAETLQHYPFRFSLRIRYALTGKTLHVMYTVHNTGDGILPFSIGAHPGFSCKLMKNESLSDVEIVFKDAERLTAQKLKGGLISDETYDVPLKNNALKLNAALFDNDALVFKHTQVEELLMRSSRRPAGIRMLCKGWPYFGIWTKKGSDDFVCLEPWYGIADSVNASGNLTEKEGILNLSAGERFKAGFDIELV
ncbi:MAG: aldose 1-epimerase family protein [Bacteroidia bacterium]